MHHGNSSLTHGNLLTLWSQAASPTAQKLNVYNSLNNIELTNAKNVNHKHVRPLYDLDKETKQPELMLVRRLNVNMKFQRGKVLINKTVSWLLKMKALSFKNWKDISGIFRTSKCCAWSPKNAEKSKYETCTTNTILAWSQGKSQCHKST